MSRIELLEWLNSTEGTCYQKVEDLCTGVTYCQMLDRLFPNTLGIKRLKLSAKLELEKMHNLRLLQNALNNLHFEKTIPIDRLAKGRLQDNLEFLQWFKKFYESHEKEAMVKLPKPHVQPPSEPIVEKPKTPTKPKPSPRRSSKVDRNRQQRQTTAEINAKRIRALEQERNELIQQQNAMESERNFYFDKLTAIENLLKESQERKENLKLCSTMLDVLYANAGHDEKCDDEIGNKKK